MENLTANLSGRVRRETGADGREYLVAPAVLIVPGVLNGSQGPLLYPPQEVERSASDWNGMPIIVYHPEDNGRPISARDPVTLNKQGVGYVYRAEYADGKLKAELWFDVSNTRRVDRRIYDALIDGRPFELSTGLLTRQEPVPAGSVHNGVAYKAIARDYKPDHLAVLPDQIGACSLRDGCGVLVNQENGKTILGRIAEVLGISWNSDEPGKESESGDPKEGEPATTNQESQNGSEDQEEGESMALNDTEKKALIDGLISNTCGCWKEADREILNKMPDENLLRLKEHADKERETAEVANAAIKGFEDQQGDSHVFNKETKQWEVKKKSEPVANTSTKTGETVNNETPAEPKQMTEDEWKKTAPPSVLETFNAAKEIVDAERKELISRLTENLSDEQKKAATEVYNSMPLNQLRAVAPKKAPAKVANQGNATPFFFGAAGAPTTNSSEPTTNRGTGGPLLVPNPNYAEWAKN